MKSRNLSIWVIAIAAMLVLLGPLASQSRGDFVLIDDQWLTANLSHSQGTLYDRSHASIVSGGHVYRLYAYDYSTVNMSSGSVSYLNTYNSSTVDIFGGSVSDHLQAFDSSAVRVSGGIVNDLRSLNSGTVDIFGGSVSDHLQAFDSSAVRVSGGIVNDLRSCDSSTVDISGGSVSDLWALHSSVVTFHGRNFSVSDGLILYGDRVLGTGLLAGEWFDGTPWTVNILANRPTAKILAIPEPATLLLLGLGAVMVRRKR